MSRAAFYDTLVTDPVLNGYGINEDTVFHSYANEERPSDVGPFIILRWGDRDRPQWVGVNSFERLTLWVHWPKELTVDYNKLIKILDQIDNIVTDLRDKAGEDGYTLSFVQVGGRSGDFLDDGFGTITKYAGYEVFSRQS
jgi:hypothetical protein